MQTCLAFSTICSGVITVVGGLPTCGVVGARRRPGRLALRLLDTVTVDLTAGLVATTVAAIAVFVPVGSKKRKYY